MYTNRLYTLKLPFYAALLAAVPLLMGAQSVDEIVQKHIDAIGSSERLRTLVAIETESIVSGPGEQVGIKTVTYVQRPNRIRVEYSFPQALVIMAYNGSIAWKEAILPDGQRRKPVILSPEKTQKFLDDFDQALDDSLFNFKEKGNKVILIGRARVMGRDAYELGLQLKNGEKERRFIDCRSFLETERTKTVKGDKSDYEIFFSSFRTWDGLTEASKIDVVHDKTTVLSTRIESVKLNRPIEDSMFAPPDSF